MALFSLDEQKLADRKAKLQNLQGQADATKRVAEMEKTYREGLTTLKDIIAPSSLKFESAYFELNGKYARSFFVLAYPRFCPVIGCRSSSIPKVLWMYLCLSILWIRRWF